MKKAKRTSWQSLLQGLLWVSPFFFPLYLLRFQVAGIPFTVLELFTYLLFVVFCLALLTKQVTWRCNKTLAFVYAFVLVLLISSFLSAFLSETDFVTLSRELVNTRLVSLGAWKGWVFAPSLYFFVLTQGIHQSKSLKAILFNFVYSGVAVSLFAYVLSLMGRGLTEDGRLAGFFESANYLSLYLAPALLLSLYFCLERQKNKTSLHWLNVISFAVLLHALILTQSYGAILAVLGALGIYALRLMWRHGKTMKKALLSLFSIFILFLALVLSQWNSPKFQQFLDWENRSSTSVRLELYQVSGHMIGQKPWLGVGPGLFQPYYQFKAPEVLDWAPLEWNMPHPHNIFLGFWLSAGLAGLFAFLAFLVLAHQKFTYPLLAFWGILIHGLVDMPFWKNDLAMVFFLIMGGVFILMSLPEHSS